MRSFVRNGHLNHLQVFVTTRTQHGSAVEEATDYYALLLRRCVAEKSNTRVRIIHHQMKESGFPHLSLGVKLVDAYLKCGSINEARDVFDEMPKRHIVTWNSMISAYVREKKSEEAVRLYRRMITESVAADEFTFSSLFKAFSHLGLLRDGRAAHARMVMLGLDVQNAFIGSALVDMYAKLGRLHDARAVVSCFDKKDVVLMTTLIVGFIQSGQDGEALEVLGEMSSHGVKPNEVTFSSLLIACGNLKHFSQGKAIHGAIIRRGLDSAEESRNSLLSMYSKCGLIDDSVRVFRTTVHPNVVTWTTMMTGFVDNSLHESALALFRDMLRCNSSPNAFTLSMGLRACSSLALSRQGRQIHAHCSKAGLDTNQYVGAALVDMYGKCGRVRMARLAFDALASPDLVSMNSMINGYAYNGFGREAIELFDRLRNLGFTPNGATFTSALSACSNAGLLEEGRRIFSTLESSESGPSVTHYACMVDLLGRAGRLEEAESLIAQAKQRDVVLWRTLLSACKVHGDAEGARRAARGVFELDAGDGASRVLLSNAYAFARRWEGVIEAKREVGLKKEAAMSWVEVGGEVHAPEGT
ncbi:Pentatricopeptide repeat-containing protein [Acorus gramineus]|uniref:Pentatricopeptide repeat-containing protein n=1 Tax=Acorus gramineus TaxID=55184 RepID=A0AAV9BKL2_ACOGR|nr:Pentatricopeptide repeat-containing protein [Acorus gramineus]